ncbi:MAG TPA: hypothetical protein VFI03_02170 [Solirubrobacterales bacterium]|nr:hypothetical protein [Solirubrobacterales bacterium]
MSTLTFVGAIGVGVTVGWVAAGTRRPQSVALELAVSVVVVAAVTLALISLQVALVASAAVLAGCALRLAVDLFLAWNTTMQRRL